MGIFQGPSSNVTIVGEGGSPKAIVTSDGRLEVDAVVSGTSPPVLLQNFSNAPHNKVLVPGAEEYRHLLMVVRNVSAGVANCANVRLEAGGGSLVYTKLPYFLMKQYTDAAVTDPFVFGSLKTDPYTSNVAVAAVGYLLFENVGEGLVYISNNACVNTNFDVYGINIDLAGIVVPTASAPSIPAANQAGIKTLTLPADSSFVSTATQAMKNVTMSTVGAPGSIAFSYDAGVNYIDIPADAVYTIAGVTDLASLSFSYRAGGSSYALKLNWEN